MVLTAVFNQDGLLDALVGGKSRAEIWWNYGNGSFRRSDQRFRYTKAHGLRWGISMATDNRKFLHRSMPMPTPSGSTRGMGRSG
jgi:hypothetical protein